VDLKPKKKSHPPGGRGSGFGLVPGCTTPSVRVRANIKSGALKIKSVRTNERGKFITIQNNLLFFLCVLLYPSFVCMYAYRNVYFQTTIIKQNIKIILIAGVSSSQALPDFLITTPPSVCVTAVFVALTVWIQNHKKKGGKNNRDRKTHKKKLIRIVTSTRNENSNNNLMIPFPRPTYKYITLNQMQLKSEERLRVEYVDRCTQQWQQS